MSSESETIEEKRRKNVMDNQQFLQSLHVFNVRDDLKSSVNSVAKRPRKKSNQKKNFDPTEVRRSTRIRSMIKTDHNNLSHYYDEDVILSNDDQSTDEENDDDLTSAFTARIDEDWQPIHQAKIPPVIRDRPVRKAAKRLAGGVKIFEPNIGLQASKVLSKEKSHQGFISKKLHLAISSSSEDEN